MTDAVDNVISLKPGRERRRVLIPRGCRHRLVNVDQDSRTVVCQQCGKTVDAFDILLGYANEEGRAFENLRFWRSEVDELIKKSKDLKRELRSLQAKIKRRKRDDSLRIKSWGPVVKAAEMCIVLRWSEDSKRKLRELIDSMPEVIRP